MQAFYAYMFSYRGCVIDLTRPAQAYKNIDFRHFFSCLLLLDLNPENLGKIRVWDEMRPAPFRDVRSLSVLSIFIKT